MTDEATDIYILGTGMVGYRQLTRECEQVLNRVARIYLLHPLPEVREFFDDQYGTVVNVTDEYEHSTERARSYKEIARLVITGATDVDEPVAFAVYGHPTVGVTPTGLIHREAENRGLTTVILPGISSLDCLYTDFDIDPLDRGLQVYEATDVLVYDITLNPATPALLMQVGLTGTRLYDERDGTAGRFAPLKRHLTRFYPSDHRISLVRTASLPFAESERTTFQISEFDAMAATISDTHSLWIPPTHERTVENEELAEKAYSQEYLDNVSER